jgi:hypothetical protein
MCIGTGVVPGPSHNLVPESFHAPCRVRLMRHARVSRPGSCLTCSCVQAFQQGGMFLFEGDRTVLTHYDPATAAHADLNQLLATAAQLATTACDDNCELPQRPAPPAGQPAEAPPPPQRRF